MKAFKDCTISTISSLAVVKVFKDCMISTISKVSSLGVVKVKATCEGFKRSYDFYFFQGFIIGSCEGLGHL